MTVSFKKPLKPDVGQGVSISKQPQNPCNFDDFLSGFKPPPLVENTTMYIYSLVVLTTTQEETPAWSIWDNSCSTSSNEYLVNYKEQRAVLQQRLKNREITGYKMISTRTTDQEDTDVKILGDYCETQFNPKPKVYINGPKKNNEFLTKKAKQYANANNF